VASSQVAQARPAAASARTGSPVVRNIAYLLGGQLVTWALSLLWSVFVPRALGPTGLGELTIAYAATGVVSVLISLGIGTLMVKEIARDRTSAPWLVGTALIVRAGFVVPAVVAVALYMHFARFGTEQMVVIWIATGSMVLSLFTGPFQAAFQGIERMEYLAYADVLTKAVVSVAGIALVFMGFGVVPVIAVALAMGAVALALSVWWSRGKFSVDWRLNPDHVRFLVVDSLPYWTTGLVLTFYMWIDSVMLSVMVPAKVVGYYAVPTKIFSTLLFVPVIFATAWLPRLSASFRESRAALVATGRPAVELVLALSAPVAAGTVLVAGPLVRDIYGGAFAPSVTVLVVLAYSLVPTYLNIMVNQVLVASNRQLAWTKVMVAAAVVNPILNLVLITYFQSRYNNGAIGAAVSLLVTELGMAVAGWALLPRGVLGRRSISRLARALVATGGMTVVVWFLRKYGLLIEVGAGAATFGALALALRLVAAEELAMVHPLLGRLPARALAQVDERPECAYGGRECQWQTGESRRPCETCRQRWV